MYRHIFNHEFNIEFQKPKSDQCDACEAVRLQKAPGADETAKHEKHVQSKNDTRNERDRDWAVSAIDTPTAVICFDLQNVVSLPRANISSFFYRRKLNVYNLTVHVAINSEKTGFCAVWNEGVAGRGANHIASALVAVLRRILNDHPMTRRMIIWSDSCVPQNRNSIISFALLWFMQNNPCVESIHQKYCEPGHSTIQEVDTSIQIEKRMKVQEVYSPVSLIRLLMQVNQQNPLRIVQMKPASFLDYQTHSRCLSFDKIPYSKVKEIVYTKPNTLQYKVSFQLEEYALVNVQHRATHHQTEESHELPTPGQCPSGAHLSHDKVNDLKAMLAFMPECDRRYMETLWKDQPEETRLNTRKPLPKQNQSSRSPELQESQACETVPSLKKKKKKAAVKSSKQGSQSRVPSALQESQLCESVAPMKKKKKKQA